MAHLPIEERYLIKRMVREQNSICSIAERLGKQQSAIAREIKNHAIECNKFAANRFCNRCVSRYDCESELVCSEKGRMKFQPGKKCSTAIFTSFTKSFLTTEFPSSSKRITVLSFMIAMTR